MSAGSAAIRRATPELTGLGGRAAPLRDVDPALAGREWRGVLSDIDDTLTRHGKLNPRAFDALARLQARGRRVVLVTGRPAGWVDHIARMWPVDGVVGENGGLWSYMEGGKLRQGFLASAEERRERRARLDALAARILREVPGCALASDQPFRALDLAVDFCEDVPPLPSAAVEHIVALFEEAGAQAKVSSIHVNGWFGDWDKLTGCRRLLRDAFGLDLEGERDSWVYFGDSANDEPMFAAFPCSVGVANVAPFLPRMRSHPRWVASLEGGDGFVEGARALGLIES
ncbi:MAG: HAD-IIB family hydrolase [Deltaproteobacteria bacterium]|nr:HAD-IIB family hydrolase [Deltaproteobacteria bacterium]